MSFIKRHKLFIAVATTVVVMNFLASLIYEGGTFTGACQGGELFNPSMTTCTFIEYYFDYFNLVGNPFVNPLDGMVRLIRLGDPGLLPPDAPWSGR